MFSAHAIDPGHGLAARRRGERWPDPAQRSTLGAMVTTVATGRAAVEEPPPPPVEDPPEEPPPPSKPPTKPPAGGRPIG